VLDTLLSTPQEKSGLFNRALDAITRLRATNRFTESETVRQAAIEFRRATDPFSVWIANNIIVDPEAYVVKSILREAYDEECRRLGRTCMSETAFSIALKRVFQNLEDTQRTVAKKLKRVWLGIGLKKIR
jgi:hypothetical protein